MREPEPYEMEIDINWGAVAILTPLLVFVPGMADAWGTGFAAAAVCVPLGVAASAIMVRRRRRRARDFGSSRATNEAEERPFSAAEWRKNQPAPALEDYSKDSEWR